jgi:hypothetical protein
MGSLYLLRHLSCNNFNFPVSIGSVRRLDYSQNLLGCKYFFWQSGEKVFSTYFQAECIVITVYAMETCRALKKN